MDGRTRLGHGHRSAETSQPEHSRRRRATPIVNGRDSIEQLWRCGEDLPRPTFFFFFCFFSFSLVFTRPRSSPSLGFFDHTHHHTTMIALSYSGHHRGPTLKPGSAAVKSNKTKAYARVMSRQTEQKSREREAARCFFRSCTRLGRSVCTRFLLLSLAWPDPLSHPPTLDCSVPSQSFSSTCVIALASCSAAALSPGRAPGPRSPTASSLAQLSLLPTPDCRPRPPAWPQGRRLLS